jgi:adenylate kinase
MGQRVHLIFIGAPGSGKGTQAKNLVKNLGFKHISTGDLLRAEIARETELGKRVTKIMESGNLVDDATVLELLEANLDLISHSYIFDGYPRNIDQAKALEANILLGHKYCAVDFKINKEILVDRIKNRRVAPKSGEIYNLKSKPPKKNGICDVSGELLVHRKDDHEDVVRNRLDVFEKTVSPVLEFYRGKGVLKEVDADLTSAEIEKKLREFVNN